MSARVPAHDLDAEAAVLSSIFLDANQFDTVYSLGLSPEHFYADSNRRIFEAIIDLRNAAGRPVDIVSVANWLKDHNSLDRVGGQTYLAQIADATPAVAHVEEHARIITSKYRLRCVVNECNTIAALGYDGPEDIDAFVQSAEARVYAASGDITRVSTAESARELMEGCVADISKRYRNEVPSGHSTGFPTLDLRIGGLREGRLYIGAGRPGQGKTSFLTQAIRSIVLSDQKRRGVLFASIEMPRNQIGERLIAQECGLDTRKVELGMLTRPEWQQVAEASAAIGKWPLIVDDRPAISVSALRSSVRRAARRFEYEYGVELGAIAIDYMQLMGDDDLPFGLNDNSRLERISAGLAGMAKEFNVPMIALSQLNRKCEERPDKRPIMSDLRSSGAIEQDAHTVFFFYRDDMYKEKGAPKDNEGEIIVAKCRGGSPGTVRCGFIAKCTKWGDALESDENDELASFKREMNDLGSFAEDQNAWSP